MTLTTHAIVGAAVASLTPEQPMLGFVLGFVSHFAADAIPHWDYQLASIRHVNGKGLETDMPINGQFYRDLVFIAADILLGFLLSIVIFHAWLFSVPLMTVVFGAAGGIAPDGLQFVYFKTRTIFLKHLQLFHIWIQQKSPIKVPAWQGIGLQCVLVIGIICLLKFL